mgnify:CR=1 FL=1
MSNLVSINDFDIVYISYDEPNADENYADLLEKCPWAKRSHGVWGSDAAHKAAAAMSETERFVTVDADNIVIDDFFNIELDMDKIGANHVISFAAKNIVNGLVYGNGGIKMWPVEVVNAMRTHEAAPESDKAAQVDFCWNIQYVQMNNWYSWVYNNGSPLQAWRAGFREGVKMSLDRGILPATNRFLQQNHIKNLQRLSIWCSVGMDIENGDWAILGARQAVTLVNLEGWDHTHIADYEFMQPFVKEKLELYKDEKVRRQAIKDYGDRLRNDLHFRVADLDAQGSIWFKSVYQNPKRFGVMITEQEADRKKK